MEQGIFWALAGAMLLVALVLIVPGLLRGTDDSKQRLAALRAQLAALKQKNELGQVDDATYGEQRAKLADEVTQLLEAPEKRGGGLPVGAVLLAVFVVVGSVAIYQRIGTPAALDPAATAPRTAQQQPGGQSAPDLAASIENLRQRLEENPDDVDGWLLLGRSYGSLNDFPSARAAYSRALQLAPDEPMVMQLLGQAIVLSGDPAGGLPREAEMLFEQALERDPNAQIALFFTGFAAMNRGDESTAVDRWSRLYATLDPASDQAAELRRLLTEAGLDPTALASATPSTPATESAPSAPADDTDGPSLNVSISVSDSLLDEVDPGDTLFVFARAAQGPRMPLAIQRLTAGQLPLTITLDSSMGMTPAMSLSTFPEVVVGARISKSGNATPQPGDMQALSTPIPNNYAETVSLVINETL